MSFFHLHSYLFHECYFFIVRPFASAFGLMPTDLPAIVALSGRRMRYAALPKVSGTQAVTSFIDGVLGGSIRTNVLDVSEAWDCEAA